MDFFIMAKQVLRFDSVHSMQEFSARFKHNYRIEPVENADPDKLKNNRSLIDLPSGMTYNGFFEKRINECRYYENHKIRKNGVRGWEIMMSYGIRDIPKDFSLDRWAELSKEWLISEFGRENIASAVLHMDEGTPHIHAMVIPIANGKLNASAYIPKRGDLSMMHKRYHEYTKEVGLEASTEHKRVSHKKTTEFYSYVGKPIEENLPGPEEGEDLKAYSERANKFYREQMLINRVKDFQIAELRRNNEALERANKYILSEIGSVETAKEAIKHQEKLENAFRYIAETDPERAERIINELREIRMEYDASLRNDMDIEYVEE